MHGPFQPLLCCLHRLLPLIEASQFLAIRPIVSSSGSISKGLRTTLVTREVGEPTALSCMAREEDDARREARGVQRVEELIAGHDVGIT